jgi:hypothetical protein
MSAGMSFFEHARERERGVARRRNNQRPGVRDAIADHPSNDLLMHARQGILARGGAPSG